MQFTPTQLQQFARFRVAAEAAGDNAVFNAEFANSLGLRREELALMVSQRAALETAARAAGLIAEAS